MADDNNLWELESGLQDMDYVFKGVRFAYDADYNNGETCLLIVEDGVSTLDDGTVDEKRQFWPCGKGWEPAEGGKSAKHATKAGARFNRNSAVGELIASIPEDALKVMQARGNPMQAATWEGLNFHMTNVEKKFKIDGEERTTNRLLIDGFNGEGKKAPAKKATRAKKAAAVEADDTETTPETEGGVPKALEIKLKKLAAKIISEDGDFDQFLEDAYDIDGVSDNSDVEDALEGIYEKAEADA